MRIKDLKKGQKFKVPDIPEWPVFTFHHLDGMYSYCTVAEGEDVVNLRFDTPVEAIENDNT